MTLHPIPLNFLRYEENFNLFCISAARYTFLIGFYANCHNRKGEKGSYAKSLTIYSVYCMKQLPHSIYDKTFIQCLKEEVTLLHLLLYHPILSNIPFTVYEEKLPSFLPRPKAKVFFFLLDFVHENH
jgi:hypothetical protein